MHANQKDREGGAPVKLETHSLPVPGHDSLAISFGQLAFLPAAPTSWPLTCLTLLEYFLDIRHCDGHCRHRDTFPLPAIRWHYSPDLRQFSVWRKRKPSSLGSVRAALLSLVHTICRSNFLSSIYHPHFQFPTRSQTFSNNRACIPLSILFLPNYIIS